jgi:hypothetical protein
MYWLLLIADFNSLFQLFTLRSMKLYGTLWMMKYCNYIEIHFDAQSICVSSKYNANVQYFTLSAF